MGLKRKNCPLHLFGFFCWVCFLLLLAFALSAPRVQGFSILSSSPRQQESLLLRLNMATTTTNVAPLYITVGPQCAGKTTLLHQLEQKLGSTIEDITLDDQRDVYVQVPTDYFLQQEEESKNDQFLQRRIQDKTLASRIYDDESNGELRAILQRLDGRLSQADFCQQIQHLYERHAHHAETRRRHNPSSNETTTRQTRPFQEMATLVIHTVRNVVNETRRDCCASLLLPTRIQLFCVESLFRAHPETNRTGVEAAHDQLWHVARDFPRTSLAWGNTNTRPREYKEALAAAATTRRPVYFVLYADNKMCGEGDSGNVFLPLVGLEELMRRNLLRLLQTGKYVPCRAVVEANDRVSTLVTSALQHNLALPPGGVSCSKFELDQELARMINFEMKPDRTVRRMRADTPNNNRKKPSRNPRR
jgi:hypothetical protein